MKRGRRCVTIFNWIYLVIIIVLSSFILKPENFGDDNWGTLAKVVGLSYPVLFSVLFGLLIATVSVLIKKLKAQNRIIRTTDDVTDNFFTKEINTLSTILILFSISYLLRVVFDILCVFTPGIIVFPGYMIAIVAMIPFDLLPIFVVLIFHRRNLSQITHQD